MVTQAKRHAIKLPRKMKDDLILQIDEAGEERMVAAMVVGQMSARGLAPSAEKLADWSRTRKEVYPTIAGYNDPLACYLVVYEICRLKPGQQISAEKMGYLLAARAPQFIWTSQTIGRILGGLATLAAETARATDREELPYVERIKLGNGPVYVVWDAAQSYLFLHAVLDALQVEVQKAMDRAYSGARVATRDTIWMEIEPNFDAL